MFVKTDEEVDADKDAEIAALQQQLEQLAAQIPRGGGAGVGPSSSAGAGAA